MKKILTVCLFAMMVNTIWAQQWMPLGTGVSGEYGAIVNVVLADTTTDQIFAAGSFDSAGNVEAYECAWWDGNNWFDASHWDDYHYDMTYFNGEVYHAGFRVSKWDGGSWLHVGGNHNGAIGALFEYNGQLLSGGSFTEVGPVIVNGLAVLDSNDSWQSFPGGGVSGGGIVSISSMAIYNGDLIVAGNFDYAGPVICHNIARWDGSQWHAMGGGTAGSISNYIITIEVFDGKLYVGGVFESAGGVPCNNFAKWDGAQWDSIGLSSIFNGSAPRDMLVNNGLLYISGGFANGRGVIMYDGQNWSDLGNSSTGNFIGGPVYSMAILGDTLYAGGSCTFYTQTDTFGDIAMLDLTTVPTPVMSMELANTIRVYPNPTTDKVYLSASLTEAKVSIINSLGQLVLQTTTRLNEPIDVSALPAGFYSLLLTSQKKREAFSFIKQ